MCICVCGEEGEGGEVYVCMYVSLCVGRAVSAKREVQTQLLNMLQT